MLIGDWVKHRGTSRIGIIKKKNDINDFFVTWHWEKGQAIEQPSVSWVSPVALVPAPLNVTKDDYKAMIDIALDTRDFSWVNALRKKA